AAGVERLAAQLGEPGELLLGRLVRAAHAEEPKASLRDADLRGRAGSAGSAALTWRSEKAAPTCAARSGVRAPVDVVAHERPRVADGRSRDRVAGLLHPPQPARPRPRRSRRVRAAADPRA